MARRSERLACDESGQREKTEHRVGALDIPNRSAETAFQNDTDQQSSSSAAWSVRAVGGSAQCGGHNESQVDRSVTGASWVAAMPKTLGA